MGPALKARHGRLHGAGGGKTIPYPHQRTPLVAAIRLENQRGSLGIRSVRVHSRLEFPGGLLRVFYLTSTSDPTSPISVVYLDLDKPSEAGSTFLAVDSLVETDGALWRSAGPPKL